MRKDSTKILLMNGIIKPCDITYIWIVYFRGGLLSDLAYFVLYLIFHRDTDFNFLFSFPIDLLFSSF